MAGVSHANHDGSSRQTIIGRCKIGEGLSLVREPSNPADPNTIKVLRANGEQLGYIIEYVASDMAQHIDKGGILRCRVSELTGGGDKWRGVNIEISRLIGNGESEVPMTPATKPMSSTFSMAALILPSPAPRPLAPSSGSASREVCLRTPEKRVTGISLSASLLILLVIACPIFARRGAVPKAAGHQSSLAIYQTGATRRTEFFP